MADTKKNKNNKRTSADGASSAAAAPAATPAATTGSTNTFKRVPAPDVNKYRAEIDVLNKNIDKLQSKTKEIEAKMPEGGHKEILDAERKEMSGKQKEVLDSLKEHRGRKTDLINKLKDLNAKRSMKQKELETLKSSLTLHSLDKIEDKRVELEKKLATGNLTLLEEKKLVAELSTLNKSKRNVEALQGKTQELDASKKQSDELRTQIDAEEKVIQEKAAQLDTLRAERENKSKNKSSEVGKFFALLNEKKELKKQIDELYAQKKKLAAEFKEQNESYRKHMIAEKARREQEKKVYLQRKHEEIKKREEEKKKLERSLPKFVDEINAATGLISYLDTLLPKETTAGNIASISTSTPSEEDLKKDGLVLLPSKKDRDDDYYAAGKNTKKGGKGGNQQDKKPAAPKKISFDITSMQYFMLLKVAVPTTVADLPKTKAELLEKKAHYETRQKEELAKAEAELMAEQEAEKQKETESAATAATGDDASDAAAPAAATEETTATPDAAADNVDEEISKAEEAANAAEADIDAATEAMDSVDLD